MKETYFIQEYKPFQKKPKEEWIPIETSESQAVSSSFEEIVERVPDDLYPSLPQTRVVAIRQRYEISSLNNPMEPRLREFLASLKYKTGVGRQVWFRVVSQEDHIKKERLGIATVLAISLGTGSSEFYNFFKLLFDPIPEEKIIE